MKNWGEKHSLYIYIMEYKEAIKNYDENVNIEIMLKGTLINSVYSLILFY